MKTLLRCLLAAVIVLALARSAVAKVKPKNFGTVYQGVSAIALDSTGFPHVAYQGVDSHLHHAWFDGLKWQRELVDGASEGGRGNSVAIDAQGHIHITHETASGLAYASFDGSSWHLTDLGVTGSRTHLQLDAFGHPHVLFSNFYGGLGYARFDGAHWQIEEYALPGSWYSSGLAVDAEGHAHVSYSVNYSGCFYATNKSGSWETTALVPDTAAATAIVLTPAGEPRVLVGGGSQLFYFSFDGANWTNEVVADFQPADPNVRAFIEADTAMSMDDQGRPQSLVPVYLTSGNRYVDVLVFAFGDGVGWNALLVDGKNTGFYPSIALDADGVAYGTYSSPLLHDQYAKAKWVRIALPDLSGAWTNVVVTGSTVTGRLTVRNTGLDKSSRTDMSLWLSDDTLVDLGDELLPVTAGVKSLKPGSATEIAVEFEHSGSLAGKHLIAIVDPSVVTADRNRVDNVVATALGD